MSRYNLTYVVQIPDLEYDDSASVEVVLPQNKAHARRIHE